LRLFSLVLKVARHGGVEFSEIEKVPGYRCRLDVLIKPSRDLGRAEPPLQRTPIIVPRAPDPLNFARSDARMV